MTQLNLKEGQLSYQPSIRNGNPVISVTNTTDNVTVVIVSENSSLTQELIDYLESVKALQVQNGN